MNLIKIMETFPTQEDCIAYLERLRWQESPECPHCETTHVRRRTERWNCHDCRSTFKATHGTLFQGTKIPLQKWFLAISLMETNAKKSLSSCQLARDLGLKQKTCWRIMMAIRVSEMGKDNVLLQKIVEADETYIGGKRKKDYDREVGEPRKRGRGTAKDVVLGVSVARGGKVVAELVEDAKGSTIAEFIKKFVKTDDSELYTDQYKGNHNEIGKQMKHETMNRSQKWEPDGIHTNTMEGFWSFVKRAWYGSHHHYSTGYTPLYLAEACYKYNYRHENIFAKFLTESMSGEI